MLIKIKVLTNAKKQKIVEKENNSPFKAGEKGAGFAFILEVSVKSKPKEGKANQEVLLLIAQYLKKPLKNMQIIKGQISPHKIIKVLT